MKLNNFLLLTLFCYITIEKFRKLIYITIKNSCSYRWWQLLEHHITAPHYATHWLPKHVAMKVKSYNPYNISLELIFVAGRSLTVLSLVPMTHAQICSHGSHQTFVVEQEIIEQLNIGNQQWFWRTLVVGAHVEHIKLVCSLHGLILKHLRTVSLQHARWSNA